MPKLRRGTSTTRSAETPPVKPIILKVIDEVQISKNYDASVNRCTQIISEIESITKKRTITYFAASIDNISAFINDEDPVQIEDILRVPYALNGLDLILNSSGGFPLSAERIINVCKTYVERQGKEFRVIVPQAAKSAATMVSLGADKTLLCDNAELGPIDPQLILMDKSGSKFAKPAYQIKQAVEELIKKSGSKDPSKNARYHGFIQQYNYDVYATSRNELALSESIAKKIFERIKKKYPTVTYKSLEIFTNPKMTLAHGRLIGIDDLVGNALYEQRIIVDMRRHFLIDKSDKLSEKDAEKLGQLIWELFIRKRSLLMDEANPMVKSIESADHLFYSTNTDWKPLQPALMIPPLPPSQP